MYIYAFFDPECRAISLKYRDGGAPATGHTFALTTLSWDIFLLIMQYCSPYELVVMGQTCKTFNVVLKRSLAVWRMARENVHNLPPPPNPSVSEPAWAMRTLTGAVDEATGLPLEWIASYTSAWKRVGKENVLAVDEYLRKDGRENEAASVIKRIRQRHIRSPTCQALIAAHQRDLKVISAPVWKAALPSIKRELACIAMCDPTRVPPGFQYWENDRILCPACHPDIPAVIAHAHALPDWASKKAWFEGNTIIVEEIYHHYENNHTKLLFSRGPAAIPRINIYTKCGACLRRPRNQRPTGQRPPVYELLTARGLVSHNRNFHGAVNPGSQDPWYSCVEVVGGSPALRCIRAIC